MLMTPSETGERAEAAVIAALARTGKRVLIPLSASQRYDLVFESNGAFSRVQCKAGREREGVIIFMTCSRTGNISKEYRHEVDFFGVYCHERDEVYLVPVDDVPLRGGRLRLEPTRNGQSKHVRWAKDFLLREEPARYDARPARPQDSRTQHDPPTPRRRRPAARGCRRL